MKMRFLAIRLQDWSQGKYGDWHKYPYLFSVLDDGEPLEKKDRKFWYETGPSYRTLDFDHARVEKDYGTVPFKEANVAHARDWPPEKFAFGQDVPACPGWVAPNGDFYPCSSYGHIGLARHISLVERGTTASTLEGRGWVMVADTYLGWPEKGITERQRTTLYAIMLSKMIYRDLPEYSIDQGEIRKSLEARSRQEGGWV